MGIRASVGGGSNCQVSQDKGVVHAAVIASPGIGEQVSAAQGVSPRHQ